MDIRIFPSKAKGTIAAPPSKSLAHRALIAAGLAAGESRVEPVDLSQDILATLDCLEQLGARWKQLGSPKEHPQGHQAILIQGSDLAGQLLNPPDPGSQLFDPSELTGPLSDPSKLAGPLSDSSDPGGQLPNGSGLIEEGPGEQRYGEQGHKKDLAPLTFSCRESGSSLRFFIPLALATGRSARFLGSKRLMERPQDIYQKLAEEKGFFFQQGTFVPGQGQEIRLQGPLQGGDFRVSGSISSQFITGLLLALPLLSASSRLLVQGPVESKPYIDLTLQVLADFGIRIQREEKAGTGVQPGQGGDLIFYIPGQQAYQARAYKIEGDQSNAAFLDALNLFGGQLELQGLNPQSRQGDRFYRQAFEAIKQGPVQMDIRHCPDLGPILFAMAGAFYGGSFTGTHRLAAKESNRILAMKEELEKFGLSLTVKPDQVTIDGPRGERGRLLLKPPALALKGHNDHRIVMSLAILCTRTGGEMEGAEAVNKSYPSFFQDLRKLGIHWKEIG